MPSKSLEILKNDQLKSTLLKKANAKPDTEMLNLDSSDESVEL